MDGGQQHARAHRPGLRIRWDRVLVLLSMLLLAVVVPIRLQPADAGVSRAPAPTLRAEARPPTDCPAPARGVLRTAPGTGRTVALTFDDGPSRWTGEVLRILRESGVKATFFVVGSHARQDPAGLRAIAADGHLIGNHTWSHPVPSGRWQPATLDAEVRRTDRLLHRLLGQPVCWFRPPGGVLPGSAGVRREHRLRAALWSVDTYDWRAGTSPEQIARRAGPRPNEPNPVVLLHDGGGMQQATVHALPVLIRAYRDAGYRFVRLDGAPAGP